MRSRALAAYVYPAVYARVLPTAPDSGMIEFVEAVPLARVLAEHRTITAFLNEHNPDGSGVRAGSLSGAGSAA